MFFHAQRATRIHGMGIPGKVESIRFHWFRLDAAMVTRVRAGLVRESYRRSSMRCMTPFFTASLKWPMWAPRSTYASSSEPSS